MSISCRWQPLFLQTQIAGLSCLPSMVACCSRTLHFRHAGSPVEWSLISFSLGLQSQGRASTRLAGLWGTHNSSEHGAWVPGRGREAALGPSARAFPDYFCSVLCAEFFDSKAMSRAEKNGDTDIRRSKNPVRFPTNLSGRGQYLLGLILGLYLYPSSRPCKLGVNSGQASNLASCGSLHWLVKMVDFSYTITLSLLFPESYVLISPSFFES